jgi:hypothetical protein
MIGDFTPRSLVLRGKKRYGADMARVRSLNRRSFLAQVVGGAANGTAAFAQNEAAPAETRRMIVDADPKDPAREIAAPRPAPDGTTGGRPPPPPPLQGIIGNIGHGRTAPPAGRFVICPGNPRCPPRQP